MQRFFSTLCVITLFSSLSLAPAFAASGPFSDVASDASVAPALVYLKEKGVISGYQDGTFHPEKGVNRAEALKMFLVGLGISITNQEVGFRDVDKGSWYAPFVAQALKNGYVKGYPDGTFKPEQEVKRVEAMKMLLEISKAIKTMQPKGTLPFSIDEGQWYAPYVKLAVDKNLVDVFDDEELRPADTMNRGDIAEMLYRYLSMKESGSDSFVDKEEGGVSYYDPNLEGHGTSSGEQYHRNIFSAAHRSYAFSTMIQVVDGAKEHSALVRVNDRGPYTPKYITDLSEAAFTTFTRLSTGVFQGSVYKHELFAGEKTYISSSFFSPLVFEKDIPNMMVKHEVYTIQYAGDASSCRWSDPSGKSSSFSNFSRGTSTRAEWYFNDVGTYILSCNGKQQKFYVTDTLYSKPLKSLSTHDAHFSSSFAGDELHLSWDATSDVNVYRLTFVQGETVKKYVVSNTTSLDVDGVVFSGMSEGKWTISLEGGYTSTGFSHDRFTPWAKLGNTEVSFVSSFRPVLQQEDLTVDQNDLSQNITEGGTLTVHGTPKTTLKNIFFVLNPEGKIEKLKLLPVNDEYVQAGKNFSVSYVTKTSGAYIVEIIRADGKPVLLSRLLSKGVFELPEVKVNEASFSAEDFHAHMLQWVNEDRVRAGLKPLERFSVLAQVAQFRCDDMVKNNYFAHYDLKGRSVNDIKKDFGFGPFVSENLAYSSEGAFAAYSELRHSPSHLENILSPNAEIVGFGFARKGTDMYVVQEFSTRPVGETNLNDLRNLWIAEAKQKGYKIDLSEPMSKVAQEWAELLVKRHEVTFSLDGRSLLSELIAAGGQGSFSANIILKDTLENARIKVLDMLSKVAVGAQIGLGVSQDETGTIKVVIGVRS